MAEDNRMPFEPLVPADPQVAAEKQPEGYDAFPVVGVGASAGGLDALTRLFQELPDQTDMSFLIVQHLDPRHESQLTELLGKSTRMPVLEAIHGLEVRPDHIYVIPPNSNMALAQRVLQITPRGEARGPHLPIDYLFRSLAADQLEHAIAIVLSGTGSDGTLGLLEIKSVGGITFAQDEKTAAHAGMPRSAIESGCVDFVLPPDEIAHRLAQIGGHPYLATKSVLDDSADAEKYFKSISNTVHHATGVDFSQYRDTTIRRRVMRRMALHANQSLQEYAERLKVDNAEVESLYRDLLINVTSFFRDPEMFESLKRLIFPAIMKTKSSSPIRIWVPGCSTGQEAYSLAMALLEFLDESPFRPPIQIFASDLSDPTLLEKARAGVYPESIEGEVSPERLRRFFKKEDHRYRIDKAIRDLCVFARQNVMADPPFSHVDLVSCRNVLIYMSSALQKRVLPIFHFALNVPGYLVLGTAETIGEFNDLFDLVDRSHKIYLKKASGKRPLHLLPLEEFKRWPDLTGRRSSVSRVAVGDFQREADRLVVSQYSPPAVLVNENFDIIQFRGRTSPFLEAPPGEPTSNVLKMARDGLFLELRSALSDAKSRNEAIQREGVRVRGDHGAREITLRILPVKPPQVTESCFLVVFDELEGKQPRGHSRGVSTPAEPSVFSSARAGGIIARLNRLVRGRKPKPAEASARSDQPSSHEELDTSQLRRELAATKEYLQSVVEQQDAANEELRSANEEILSSNEELQSTNEELE